MRRRDFITGVGAAACLPIASPLATRAQQRALPVIGWLTEGPVPPLPLVPDTPFSRAVRRGLAEQGFLEGRNVEILQRADLQYDRFPMMAADLVRRRVAVILATGGSPVPALAAKSATTTIPIVFVTGVDPVEFGPRCEPQPSGRQRHGRDRPRPGFDREAS